MLAVCAAIGLGCPSGNTETSGTSGEPDTDTDTDTDTGYQTVPSWNQECELAPPIFSGTTPGTFHDLLTAPGEYCGASQVPIFGQLDIEHRADIEISVSAVGFEPSLLIAPANCDLTAAQCLDTSAPVMLRDYQPGSSLRVIVAVPEGHPDLMTPPPEEGPGNLDFSVMITKYPVKELGERCGSKELGRCAAGGVCQPTDPDNLEGIWTCVAVSADSCNDPEVVELAADPVAVVLDPLLQSDAHYHSCTGDLRPERVFAVQLPADVTDGQKLIVRSPDAVGLAMRAPGCLAADEVACVAEDPQGAAIELEGIMTPEGFLGLQGMRVAGIRPLLFVELPVPPDDDAGDTDGEPFPQSVTVELELQPI